MALSTRYFDLTHFDFQPEDEQTHKMIKHELPMIKRKEAPVKM